MASIPELLDGHVTLEVMPGPVVPERLQGTLGDIGWVSDIREQLGKPVYQFDHKERKDDVANDFRRKREVRDGVMFAGVAPFCLRWWL